MITTIIILALAAVGLVVYLVKTGKLADRDGDLIPDKVEDAVDNAKATVKEVKARAKVVKKEVEDVIEEVKDISKAVKGQKRRGRKPKAPKK